MSINNWRIFFIGIGLWLTVQGINNDVMLKLPDGTTIQGAAGIVIILAVLFSILYRQHKKAKW